MRRRTGVFSIVGLTLALTGLTACGPSQEEVMAEAENEALAQLEVAKGALMEKRQELEDARAAVSDIDMEAEGAEDLLAELQGKLGPLEGEVIGMGDDFTSAIVDFINTNPPIEGEPMTESQQAAIRMKSAEDIVLAQEHIDKGGDYRRAMDIYNQALVIDPGNPDLEAALARSEELRFMTQERFSQVEKGMSEPEVRSLLGQANLRNVRDYPDREVKAWFYPINEAGDAAAVWFKADKAGGQIVYQTKYDAIRKGDETGE